MKLINSKKIYLFYFFIIPWFGLQIHAQSDTIPLDLQEKEILSPDDDPLFFAYAQSDKESGNAVINPNLNPNDSYRYDVVKKVLDDLIMARGDKRQQRPRLVISNEEKRVAYMKSRDVEIGLEVKAYELCISMGADSLNAIAALLGHEIIHYYEKHHWTKNFAKQNMDLQTGRNLRKSAASEKLKLETQADYLGGFLGYSAGYNTIGIMPKLLNTIYKGYDLNNYMKGYPSLADRDSIARHSMRKLQNLVHIYEMAQYLTVIGEYESARRYYKMILKDFQSRELYNNLGVISFLQALQLFTEEKEKFGYPIELDVNSRLKGSNTKGGEDINDVISKLLEEAAINFEAAISLDKEYATGYLNMACTKTLGGELQEAEFWAMRALKYAKSGALQKLETDTYIIQGIIAQKNGVLSEAEEYFSNAMDLGNELARLNYGILKGSESSSTTQNPAGFSFRSEQIEDLALSSITRNIEKHVNPGFLQIEIDKKTSLFVIEKDHSLIYVSRENGGDGSFNAVYITKGSYPGQSMRGIQLGDQKSKLESKDHYGPCANSIESNKGQYLIYDSDNIFFHTDMENNVEKWALFEINKSK